ncbi:MAG: radical SAM protein [Treponema sp.]|nr:radical SAM protein [Treponema sp.]
MKKIVLTTINAKWIHPSLALRLLKANLGSLEDSCQIIEFALRQPLDEKLQPLLTSRPKVLGFSVSIWNHTATIELLKELFKEWEKEQELQKPIIVLGGPEVSHLPPEAEIFEYADHVIRGEGEIAFRLLNEDIFAGKQSNDKFITADNINLNEIKSAYHLYTDEDLVRKLIYVEASRGCVFNCEFCLSSVKSNSVREFPLEPFLKDMDILIQRGVKTFKFLDRSINTNPKRTIQIINFFLNKIEKTSVFSVPLCPRVNSSPNIVVHFEMVPSIFPPELREALTRFPPGTLRLEIGIQTLNTEVAKRIGRICNPEKELETLRFLREKTNAIIHADLIAGLPGEDLLSFAKGFDNLWQAVSAPAAEERRIEIQLGILKLLPGAPICCHNETFIMFYNPLPPYEVLKTSTMSADDISRIKNFARFWEMIVNRGLINLKDGEPVFERFMTLSDELFSRFGRNWGIDKNELREAVTSNIFL